MTYENQNKIKKIDAFMSSEFPLLSCSLVVLYLPQAGSDLTQAGSYAEHAPALVLTGDTSGTVAVWLIGGPSGWEEGEPSEQLLTFQAHSMGVNAVHSSLTPDIWRNRGLWRYFHTKNFIYPTFHNLLLRILSPRLRAYLGGLQRWRRPVHRSYHFWTHSFDANSRGSSLLTAL